MWNQVCAGVCKCVAQVCVVCVAGKWDVCAGVAEILCVCTDVRGVCVQMYEMQVCKVRVRGGGAGTAADPQAADRAGVLNLGARLTSGQDVVRPPGGSGSPRGGGRSLPGHSGRVVGVWHRPEVLPDSPGEGASWVGVGQQLSPAW